MSTRIDAPTFGVQESQLCRQLPAAVLHATEQAGGKIARKIAERISVVEPRKETGDVLDRFQARRELDNLEVLGTRIDEAVQLFCQGRTARARDILSSLQGLISRTPSMSGLLDKFWEIAREFEQLDRKNDVKRGPWER